MFNTANDFFQYKLWCFEVTLVFHQNFSFPSEITFYRISLLMISMYFPPVYLVLCFVLPAIYSQFTAAVCLQLWVFLLHIRKSIYVVLCPFAYYLSIHICIYMQLFSFGSKFKFIAAISRLKVWKFFCKSTVNRLHILYTSYL